MKSRFIRILFLIACAASFALSQEAETLFSGEIEHGGFGGPVIKGATINNVQGVFVGGRGGWIINHSFSLGGGGYGLASNINAKVPSVYGDSRLAFGYGGLELEYVHHWDRLYHISAMVLIGGGGVGYRRMMGDAQLGFDSSNPMDDVFVVEPSVQLNINVTEFFRVSAGASYLYVSGVTTPATSNGSLSGGMAVVTFRFGKF